MQNTFLITFPVWGIFIAPVKLPELLWKISVNQKQSPTFFTDLDQAERFVQREISQRPLTLIQFPDTLDFLKFVRLLRVDEVSFDPGEFNVHQAKICDLEKILLETT